jgi:hypothetical protein
MRESLPSLSLHGIGQATYCFALHRSGKEIQRKRNADALFHLTRPQIIEEEALYMELKKMEQTERRYRGEREDLMRRVNGLESGVLWPSASVPGGPGTEGNRVFGNGMAVGIGAQRARDGTVVGVDKVRFLDRVNGKIERWANGYFMYFS